MPPLALGHIEEEEDKEHEESSEEESFVRRHSSTMKRKEIRNSVRGNNPFEDLHPKAEDQPIVNEDFLKPIHKPLIIAPVKSTFMDAAPL
jgi:hypothetical protein